MGIQRMKTHPDYSIEALAVISEETMIPLCEKYGVNWIMYKNEPLGEKKNAGLQKAKEFEFDYLMEIGSDDLILNELLTDYKKYLGNDVFGITDAAYINSETGECRRLISRHSTYGAGRMISRKALQAMNWKLWNDGIAKGMDNNSVLSLQRKGFKYIKAEPIEFPCVIDVKSQQNIWKFNYFLGVPYELSNILDKISPQEKEIIESYATVEHANS
jgi:hypothetical protein